MNGTSAALMISDIPFPVPVGAVRIGQDAEGDFIVNPDEEWLSSRRSTSWSPAPRRPS